MYSPYISGASAKRAVVFWGDESVESYVSLGVINNDGFLYVVFYVAVVNVCAVKNATEILLDSVDYFTILLTGISGIFVNNIPLSS